MTTQDAAVARLEEQVKHLTEDTRELKDALRSVSEQLDAVRAKLDQSAGGIAVLRWLGLGSLGSALAVCAAVYGYLKSH